MLIGATCVSQLDDPNLVEQIWGRSSNSFLRSGTAKPTKALTNGTESCHSEATMTASIV